MKLRGPADTQPLEYSKKDLLRARAKFIFKNHKRPIIISATIIALTGLRMALAPGCSAAEKPETPASAQEEKKATEKELVIESRGAKKISAEQKRLNDDLLEAAALGKWRKVEELLEAGADVDARDNGGYTPVMKAVLNSHKKTIDILCDKGADLKAKNKWGTSVREMTTNDELLRILRKMRYN